MGLAGRARPPGTVRGERRSSWEGMRQAVSVQVPAWAARRSVVWLRREHCLSLARAEPEAGPHRGKGKRKRPASVTRQTQ